MPVEIFTRDQFEKALNFSPLGFKVIGLDRQYVYKIPMAHRLICGCGQKFYPVPGYKHAQCPKCGEIRPLNGSLVPGEVYIYVYSSVDPRTGLSRDTGEDSIRLVLMDGGGKPLAKLGHYVTRLPGWGKRLKKKCQELWKIGIRLPRCKKGHKARLSTCRNGPNKGKVFAKCYRCQKWLGWMEV